MSEFKPTPGEWWSSGTEVGTVPMMMIKIACTSGSNIQEARDNAHLLADAGNTYHATGMTPSQLAERVKVLEDALTMLLSYTKSCEAVLNCTPAGQIAIAEKALAK